jgi:hypothetical protein
MNTTRNLPFLPGYNIDTAPHSTKEFKRSHIFDKNQGTLVETNRRELSNEQKNFPMGDPLQVASIDYARQTQQQRTRAAPESTMSRLPSWVAYDRKVLRFYGFFKEMVQSDARETWRIRKCVIHFYLEDDSIHISEPVVENSGIPQGAYVKRHRIPKSNNQYITLEDLGVGREVTVYGRVFRMISCDDFTRAFYESRGIPLADNERYPVDPFTKKNTYRQITNNKLMNPLKHFMEADLGKQMGQNIEATQQFLRNDGKVLRFYCTWSDDSMYGERRTYVVHYFLADDTVEVREVHEANSGRDPFPALLQRSRLPKNFRDNTPSVPRIGLMNDSQIDYYVESDFKVGGTVEVYGRQLFINGCDEFTQQFYMENYGMRPEDFPRIQMEAPQRAVPLMAPPKYNGFGSEEDSLGSFLYLMPKVPKRDFKKLMENDGINLRFLAKFITPAPEDAERVFIITFYMSDDTLGIYEKFQRNSGFIGGKFLERCRIRNVNTHEFFRPGDFVVGQPITINHQTFILEGCDEYTGNFIGNNSHIFPNSQM